MCHSVLVKRIKGREKEWREAEALGRGGGPARLGEQEARGAGARVPPHAWESCSVAMAGQWCSGRVSSLKSPADQSYAANERPAVSFKAFIPHPLPVAVLSVLPVPVDVGTRGREGGTPVKYCFGNPALKKST